ncbi:380_t:CDS:1, partial [Entrophospora sp. SA101]
YSDHLVPIIDDLTMKKEFIVIDTRWSKDDPLSIRHMWDARTEILPKDSKAFNITKEKLEPKINKNLVNIVETRISDSSSSQSKFSIAGQEAISQAKKENRLVKFARNMPSPNKRKELLSEGIQAKNSDTWAKYIYQEAFNIKDKDLGPGWLDFIQKVKENIKYPSPIVLEKNSQLLHYKDLLDSRPLDEKKIYRGM